MNKFLYYDDDIRCKRIMDFRFNELIVLPELSNSLIILQLSNNLFENIDLKVINIFILEYFTLTYILRFK